jgi:hypothetical protein
MMSFLTCITGFFMNFEHNKNFIPPFFYFELGGHFGWKSGSPDTFLEGGHPRIISAKFGSSNFNCSYMARSSLTYIPSFSVKFFFQSIYTDYAN